MLKRLAEGWLLLLILLFIVCAGAARKPCRNYVYGKDIRAVFDPAKCWDTEAPRWKCNDVEFDPQRIDVAGR